ncbi:MAG: hypothetical protein HN491_13645, partial [Rhodospirillales bacterium]|nr:hypothetical protein [Rhodospirillales bacterium]
MHNRVAHERGVEHVVGGQVHLGHQLVGQVVDGLTHGVCHFNVAAGHLCELLSGEVVSSSGIMNPQIRFGEDLMSRVSYVMMNPGGDVEMTNAVREAINHLTNELVTEVDLTTDDVLNATFVG